MKKKKRKKNEEEEEVVVNRRQKARVLNSFFSLSLHPSCWLEASYIHLILAFIINVTMMTLAHLTWLLFSSILVYGQDDNNTMLPPVNTTFSCRGRDTGFYADLDNDCEVYHTCDNHGNKFTYYCPKETKFRQETLVCDHAHLVNCKSAEKLIEKFPQNHSSSDNSDSFRSSSVLSRSFTISQVPSRLLEPPKENSKKSTTFTMSSTVFLRNSNVKKSEHEKIVTLTASTTSTVRPFHLNRKFKDGSEFSASEMPKNREFHGLRKETRIEEQKSTGRPFFQQRDNYPYRETLRSIQSRAEEMHHLTGTTQRTTTAGTEFPIPAFRNDAFGYSANDEDPYYPKHSSTEIYYTLKSAKSQKPAYFSSTPRPFLSSLNIKIPDVLPDFNSVDDLVDRRKILYIPRTKSL